MTFVNRLQIDGDFSRETASGVGSLFRVLAPCHHRYPSHETEERVLIYVCRHGSVAKSKNEDI